MLIFLICFLRQSPVILASLEFSVDQTSFKLATVSFPVTQKLSDLPYQGFVCLIGKVQSKAKVGVAAVRCHQGRGSGFPFHSPQQMVFVFTFVKCFLYLQVTMFAIKQGRRERGGHPTAQPRLVLNAQSFFSQPSACWAGGQSHTQLGFASKFWGSLPSISPARTVLGITSCFKDSRKTLLQLNKGCLEADFCY